MEILVDIGNTTIAIALYENDMFVKKTIISTDVDKVEDEYYLILSNLLKDIEKDSIEHIVISSVVPKVTRNIKHVLQRLFGVEPNIVSLGIKTGVMIKIDNPSELGTDLVCDIVGGVNTFDSPMIIADIGTASKILVIDKNKAFIGCVIAPGIISSAITLIDSTSLLPETDLTYPKHFIGKNTSDSLKSGMVIGHAEMIIGMCHKIEKELGYSCKKVFTGGNSFAIKDYLIKSNFIYDENLIFSGLNILLKKNFLK